eukprot:5987477-Amphidinium_carterae.1
MGCLFFGVFLRVRPSRGSSGRPMLCLWGLVHFLQHYLRPGSSDDINNDASGVQALTQEEVA